MGGGGEIVDLVPVGKDWHTHVSALTVDNILLVCVLADVRLILGTPE